MEAVQTVEHPNFESVWAALQEVARRQKKTYKLLGRLGGRLGDMVEHLVAPNLVKKFGKLGVVFEKSNQNVRIKDIKNNIFAEADIILENSEKVMIIEVKSKLTTEDITKHIERMGKMRAYADKHNDKRKFLGAVASMVFSDNEKEFAFKNGFYVLEPSGETFTIAVPEGTYSVRVW